MHAKAILFALLIAVSSAPAAAAENYLELAAQAAAAGQRSVTVFVDTTWGFRTRGASKEINRAHQAFDAKGYVVVDLESYLENGDLVGFFVTYAKR